MSRKKKIIKFRDGHQVHERWTVGLNNNLIRQSVYSVDGRTVPSLVGKYLSLLYEVYPVMHRVDFKAQDELCLKHFVSDINFIYDNDLEDEVESLFAFKVPDSEILRFVEDQKTILNKPGPKLKSKNGK